MYWIGCSSIYIFTAMSAERFYIVYDPMSLRKLNFKFYLKVVLGCISIGFFWSILPVIGWSHYSLEGAKTSCSVEWIEKSKNVISYNVIILLLVFFVPLVIMLIVNFKLVKIVSNFNIRYT